MNKYIYLLLCFFAVGLTAGCAKMEKISGEMLGITNNVVDTVPFVQSAPSQYTKDIKRREAFEQAVKVRIEKEKEDDMVIRILENIPPANTTGKTQYERNVIYYLDTLRTRRLNEMYFRRNFCRSTGTSKFDQLASAEACNIIMRSFPGSQVSCFYCTGTWVSGNHTAVFAIDGHLVKDQLLEGPIKIHTLYPPEYAPTYSTFRVSDDHNNYITLKFSGDPKKYITYSVLDAHLPDAVSTALQIYKKNKNPSIEIRHNALITLLNNGYQYYPDMNIFEYATGLLVDLDFRRNFLSVAVAKKHNN